MNSDTQNQVDEILVRAGAVEKCPVCHDDLISAEDEDAEGMAYAMATNAWKGGERGFRGMDREEVMSLVKKALVCVPVSCPRCSRN
jgi:hypothetical protein